MLYYLAFVPLPVGLLQSCVVAIFPLLWQPLLYSWSFSCQLCEEHLSLCWCWNFCHWVIFKQYYYYTHVNLIYICNFLLPLIGIRRQNTNKHILLSSCIYSRFFILYLSSCETHLLNFLISIMTLKILQDDEKMTVHVKDFFLKRLKHIGHFV